MLIGLLIAYDEGLIFRHWDTQIPDEPSEPIHQWHECRQLSLEAACLRLNHVADSRAYSAHWNVQDDCLRGLGLTSSRRYLQLGAQLPMH